MLLEDVPLAVRARMWYKHDGAAAHFSCAVRDVLNNAYHDWWIGIGGLTAWPPRSQGLNPLNFYLKAGVDAAPIGNKRHFTISLWMPGRLSANTLAFLNDAAVHVEACIESREYKRTPSSITHKLIVSGHVLIWTIFLALVFETRAQNISAPFSYTLYWWRATLYDGPHRIDTSSPHLLCFTWRRWKTQSLKDRNF
jgi:hypothetical protein